MMSQIWSRSSCSLPACASALLHALKARSARFSRRSSLLIRFSLTESAAETEKEEGVESREEEKEDDDGDVDDDDETTPGETADDAETPRAAESVPSNSDFPCVMEPANPTFMEFRLAVVYSFPPSPGEKQRVGDGAALESLCELCGSGPV